MSEPLLLLHVLGTPKPKGSMRHVGHGRMVEQVGGSRDWRDHVAIAAHRAWRQTHSGPETRPIKVDVVLDLPKPQKPKDPHYPSTAQTGDIDKHARNILDALQDAAIVRNDAQVVDLHVAKRWSTFAPGAHICVYAVGSAPAAETQTPAAGAAGGAA